MNKLVQVQIYFGLIIFSQIGFSQTPGEIVTDFDGNEYTSVIVGNQTWLGENLKSTHYCDGTEIEGVVAYNNDESLAAIYGRLYTWDAAMNNTNIPGTRGVCPCGWHVPTDEEWAELENFLGGANIAGGKMKGTGTTYWNAPNTGADNSSGLNFLPGGEYDDFYNPHQFRLLNEYAVLWTSTEINGLKARERFLSYNDAKSAIYDWYKVMKYSIRCIKDTYTTSTENSSNTPTNFNLKQNYPNPFNPTTTIEYYLPYSDEIKISIFDVLGNKKMDIYSGYQEFGAHKISFSGSEFPSGIYFYKLTSTHFQDIKSCLLIK